MAILKTNKYLLNTASVTEDPIPSSTYTYFQHDAYNKTTFAPQFDTWLQHNATGTSISGFGYAAGADRVYGGTLMLTGNVTHVNHTGTATGNAANNLDMAPFISMDTTRPFSWVKYYNDGTNVSVWYQYNVTPDNGNATGNMYFIYKLNPGTDLTKTLPTNSGNAAANPPNVGGNVMGYPVYINPTTKNLVFAALSNNNTTGYYYPYRADAIYAGPLGTGNINQASLWQTRNIATAQQTVQFLGVGSDGYAVFLGNNVLSDIAQTIYKVNDVSGVTTALATLTAAPSAGGSSLGGDRTTNFGSYFVKTASCTFQDPLLGAGTQGFYLPYFDTSGNYVPFYFQWTVSTGVITRNANVTITWTPRTQATTWAVDTVSGSLASQTYGLQRLVHNETFLYSGTRYLTMMQLHGSGTTYDSLPLARTFVTFSMNPTNPLALTYHSFVQIPVTPKNIVWLNTAKSVLGVFGTQYFFTYSFNATNGWVLTGTLPYQYWAVGTDSTGRIWGIDRGITSAGQIHIITLSVPVTVSVVPAQTTYNYTGTTISSTLAVSAYDQNGNRIATSVKLVIDGGSMTFGGSNLTTTVTTSATGDISVAISITDGGYSNIIASVALS